MSPDILAATAVGSPNAHGSASYSALALELDLSQPFRYPVSYVSLTGTVFYPEDSGSISGFYSVLFAGLVSGSHREAARRHQSALGSAA